MKYLTNKRHDIIRSMLHTYNLDIGCGDTPITKDSVRADIGYNGINVCHLPFPDSEFDSVTALELLEHLDMNQLLYAMHEITRVLTPKGQLVISVPNHSWYMRDFQNISWFIRRHITLRDYETSGHINMQTPMFYRSLLTHYGYNVIEEKRAYLYDYIFRAIKI